VLRNLVNGALRLGSFPERDRRSRDTLLGDSAIMQTIRHTIAKAARRLSTSVANRAPARNWWRA